MITNFQDRHQKLTYSQSQMAAGPPYASMSAGLGGLPTVGLDVPITAVFMFLFMCGAATHMTILQLNSRKGHKFLASGALFGFCMARIVACIMRIVWATHPHNVRVAIAANIFLNAGVLLIIVINLIFAQRILRATLPHIGWHRAIHFAFLAFYGSIILVLGGLITAIIQTSYTLDTHIQSIDHKVQLAGVTYFAVASFVPIIILTLAFILPKKTRVGKFGTGRFRHKIIILLTAATLVCFGASFRAAVFYMPRPIAQPAPIDSRAAFYCVDFTIEIFVIYMYAIMRVDRRFHVPDGSSAPGHYSAGTAVQKDEEAAGVSQGRFRVEGDEEVLDCEQESMEGAKSLDWEKEAGEERIEGSPPVAVRAA
jgi:hypothetical protein